MKINITKRFLLSLCLMTLTLLCGGNKAWGQAATTLFLEDFGTTGNKTAVASYTGWSATSSMFTEGTVSRNYSSPDASKINSTDESSYDGASGSCNVYNQGVANTTKTILQITNINIEGYSDITLNFGCFFASTQHKIDVSYIIDKGTEKDNGTETNLTLDTYTVTKGNQWLYLSGKIPSTGKSLTLIFRHTPTKGWLMRLDDIKVTGVASTSTPAPTFSHATGTYNGPQHVTITAPKGYTEGIVYTTDGTDPTESSSAEYYSDAGIDINTTTTLRAVAYDSEFNFSSEATATYTIRSTDQKTYSVTFDFSKPADYGYNAPEKGSGTDLEVGKTIVSGDVTITHVTNGSKTNTRFYNSNGTITFRPYKGAELSISVPAGYVITSIETQGSAGVFSLGGNTAEGGVSSWEGISQTVVLDNITANAELTSMTVNYRLLYFSDTENLTASLPETALADQTVTLDRKVYSGWNTFCVPFALTQEQLEEAYGSGAVAKYLSKVTTGAEGATLHFTPENGGGIKANKAYLLHVTNNVTKPKTFSDVTLEPAGKCTTTVNTKDGDYTFQGILKPTTLTTDDTQYFLNSAGTNFVLPSNSTSAMKATRAYITVPVSGSAQGRQYSFDFNGTTTGIDNVNISGLEDGAWYTISGIRVNRPAAKGVYIHNGRKVIVK